MLRAIHIGVTTVLTTGSSIRLTTARRGRLLRAACMHLSGLAAGASTPHQRTPRPKSARRGPPAWHRPQVLPLPRAEAALRLLQLAQPSLNVFHSLGEIASRGISATERATRPAPGQCSAHGDRQHDEGDADRPFRDDSEHTPPRGAELSASTPLAALLAEARAPPQLKRRV